MTYTPATCRCGCLFNAIHQMTSFLRLALHRGR